MKVLICLMFLSILATGKEPITLLGYRLNMSREHVLQKIHRGNGRYRPAINLYDSLSDTMRANPDAWIVQESAQHELMLEFQKNQVVAINLTLRHAKPERVEQINRHLSKQCDDQQKIDRGISRYRAPGWTATLTRAPEAGSKETEFATLFLRLPAK